MKRLVTVTAGAEKRCPYKDEVDVGSVTLVFSVEGDAPELHGLALDLGGDWRDEALSHEDFTEKVFRRYAEFGCVAVHSEWETAGLAVAVDVPDRRG